MGGAKKDSYQRQFIDSGYYINNGAGDYCADEHGSGLGDSSKIKPNYFYMGRAYISKNNIHPPSDRAEGSVSDRAEGLPQDVGYAEGSIEDREPLKQNANGPCDRVEGSGHAYKLLMNFPIVPQLGTTDYSLACGDVYATFMNE